VLVVEDDRALAVGLDLNLSAEGFEVFIAGDGAGGLALAEAKPPDLVILDLRLPDMDGLEVLAGLRLRRPRIPVIVLSARGEERDKIRGLDEGADDYVTKPFSLGELVARINAHLRRSRPQERRVVQVGEADVDIGGRQVQRGGRTIQLTAREFDLLAYLLENPGRAHSRDALLTAVWGHDYDGTTRTVDNFVRSLRLTLERDPARPQTLVTVRGVGYRLDL
jgi:DNA-binding response OmpR family regulator